LAGKSNRKLGRGDFGEIFGEISLCHLPLDAPNPARLLEECRPMTHPDQASIRDKRGRLLHGRPPHSSRQAAPRNARAAILATEPARLSAERGVARRAAKTIAATAKQEKDDEEIGASKPLAVSVREARRMLSIGNSLTWRLIGRGKLETIRLGARRLVLVKSIERLIKAARVKKAA
jgi:hypothetical protein